MPLLEPHFLYYRDSFDPALKKRGSLNTFDFPDREVCLSPPRKSMRTIVLRAAHSPVKLCHFPSAVVSHRCCSSAAAAVAEPRASHARFLRTSDPSSLSNPYTANCIADAYRKAGRLRDALYMLDEIPQPNPVSWNLKISIHNQRHKLSDSLLTFVRMRASGCLPTELTYGVVLSAAAMAGNLSFASQIHALVIKNSFSSNGYVVTGLVDLFCKNNFLREALELFSENPSSNVVVWNAMISGASRNGYHSLSLQLFLRMVGEFSYSPNEFTLSAVLTACAQSGDLNLGRSLHGRAIKSAATADIFVASAIIDLYAKSGDTAAAATQFSEISSPNVVTFTTMISAFSLEAPHLAVSTFRAMIASSVAEINSYTLTGILLACQDLAMGKELSQIHGFVFKSGFFFDPVVVAALINSYARSGSIILAEKLFNEELRDLVSWAAMISAFASDSASQEKCFPVVREMMREGVKPDEICSCSALSAVKSMEEGRQLHALSTKTGLTVFLALTSALFTMYSKCGSLEESWRLFLEMPERDAIAWTSMIAGFSQRGLADEAFSLLREMMTTTTTALDPIIFSHIVILCGNAQYLMRGKEAHAISLRLGFSDEEQVHAALISLYSKCGIVGAAARLFSMVRERDKKQMAWSAMIGGYSRNGLAVEAIETFKDMLVCGFCGDYLASAAAIAACSDIAMKALGKQLHAHAVKNGSSSDLSVITSIITMHACCGSIEYAKMAFEEADPPDLVTWTAMIDGYSINGRGDDALRVFDAMIGSGVRPDALTFVSVLTACSRCGLVEEGLTYFRTMEVFGVDQEEVHRTCVVDLLARAGRLEEAREFVERTAAGEATVWAALMGACKVNGDIEMGRVAAEKVLELAPDDGGAYVALLSLSAHGGDWKEAVKVRGSMRSAGVKKEAGWSFLG